MKNPSQAARLVVTAMRSTDKTLLRELWEMPEGTSLKQSVGLLSDWTGRSEAEVWSRSLEAISRFVGRFSDAESAIEFLLMTDHKLAIWCAIQVVRQGNLSKVGKASLAFAEKILLTSSSPSESNLKKRRKAAYRDYESLFSGGNLIEWIPARALNYVLNAFLSSSRYVIDAIFWMKQVLQEDWIIRVLTASVLSYPR